MSHEIFKIGDRVEVIDGEAPHFILSRAVCVGQQGTINQIDGCPPLKVGVLYDNGHDCYSLRASIRKLPPPSRENVSSWDDVIVWRPKETEHV